MKISSNTTAYMVCRNAPFVMLNVDGRFVFDAHSTNPGLFTALEVGLIKRGFVLKKRTESIDSTIATYQFHGAYRTIEAYVAINKY